MKRDILLLGDERLYQKSRPVERSEYAALAQLEQDLHDTLLDYRARYGAGRAIAAPQIGDFRRVIYMNTDEPRLFVNPALQPCEHAGTFTVRDDCMSLPGLKVDVLRYSNIRFEYDNAKTGEHVAVEFFGDLAELLQHEYDHLEGILATMRAKDNKSFYYCGDPE